MKCKLLFMKRWKCLVLECSASACEDPHSRISFAILLRIIKKIVRESSIKSQNQKSKNTREILVNITTKSISLSSTLIELSYDTQSDTACHSSYSWTILPSLLNNYGIHLDPLPISTFWMLRSLAPPIVQLSSSDSRSLYPCRPSNMGALSQMTWRDSNFEIALDLEPNQSLCGHPQNYLL